MNVLKRLAMMFGFGLAATLATTVPAQAGDWGVSLHGGQWNNGWSVHYQDRDRHYGNGYAYGYRNHGYRPAPVYIPYRPNYYRNDRHVRHDQRRYDRRAPWCRSHRAYHVHSHNSHGYRNSSYGYGDGRYERSDYGSAAYYDRIDEMSYDTSIYYNQRW